MRWAGLKSIKIEEDKIAYGNDSFGRRKRKEYIGREKDMKCFRFNEQATYQQDALPNAR